MFYLGRAGESSYKKLIQPMGDFDSSELRSTTELPRGVSRQNAVGGEGDKKKANFLNNCLSESNNNRYKNNFQRT